MKNLLALIGTITLLLVGAGAFLGWYRVEPKPAASGTARVEVVANSDKACSDVAEAVAKLLEVLRAIQEKTK